MERTLTCERLHLVCSPRHKEAGMGHGPLGLVPSEKSKAPGQAEVRPKSNFMAAALVNSAAVNHILDFLYGSKKALRIED